jgi:hypothetical protein
MPTDRLRPFAAFLITVVLAPLAFTSTPGAQAPVPSGAVTFTKDIAPILQKSCQGCHHADGVAPMSLVTYDEVRPWARAMKTRTALRSQRGAMPPFFVEKNIGIQKFKHDPSLTEEQIVKIGQWADSGAPRGNPADMPKPLDFDETDKWTIGEPDLILNPEVLVPPPARLVGRYRAGADRSDRGSLRVGRRSARGERHSHERPDEDRRRTLRLSPHDVLERAAG